MMKFCVFRIVMIFVVVSCLTGAQSVTPEQHESTTFGIDYEHPEKYLLPGTQSRLTDERFAEIAELLQVEQIDLPAIQKIDAWKRRYFREERGGGKYVGRHTAEDVFAKRVLTGCHDHGLVLVTLLRRYGVPAVYVDATGIEWGLNYSENTRVFRGHVFVELFLQDRWMLFDSTSGQYIKDYDPKNPIIPMRNPHESQGHYVMFKGLDPADYGITSLEQLTETQKVYANTIKAEAQNFHYPEYHIER